MAEAVVIKAELREKTGTRTAERLRKAGRVPATVYGHKEKPTSVSVSLEELVNAIKKHSHDLHLNISGKDEEVLIQELQADHLGKEILHVDFRRVSASDTIKIDVPVTLKGDAVGVRGGGTLVQPLHTVHVECRAADRPDFILVKIDDLALGQAIHVRELTLPAGVKVTNPPESVVVQIKLAGMTLDVPAPGTEGGVEPEVITAKKPKEEE